MREGDWIVKEDGAIRLIADHPSQVSGIDAARAIYAWRSDAEAFSARCRCTLYILGAPPCFDSLILRDDHS